jgi:cation diffusion facilitator family transporter
MHESDEALARWQRDHLYLGEAHRRNEGRTRMVLVLTLAMMVAEIAAGTVFGSMALLADGWHMGSHAAALGLAGAAYLYARRHADNAFYSFGTGKVGDLAGFSSALILGVIALAMVWESVGRLFAPVDIKYGEALWVAVLGLMVNLVSAWILGADHTHDEDHEGPRHGEDHADDHAEDHVEDHGNRHAHHRGHHHDHNFRAVYVHVLADAVTSVLAIGALLAGRYAGWNWLDPVVGIVGAAVIARWAWSLMARTSRILLDAEPVAGVTAAVRAAIEGEADNRVADLHVWRLGPGHLAAMLTVVTHHPRGPAHYKHLLHHITGLSHITVEVEACDAHPPRAAA